MPKVTIRTYAQLREYTRGQPRVDVDLPQPRPLGNLLEQLGIPGEKTRIVFVNNRAANREHLVQPGDTVDVFSAIGGG